MVTPGWAVSFEFLGFETLARQGLELGVRGAYGFMETGGQRYQDVSVYLNKIPGLFSLEMAFWLDRSGFARVVHIARFFKK